MTRPTNPPRSISLHLPNDFSMRLVLALLCMWSWSSGFSKEPPLNASKQPFLGIHQAAQNGSKVGIVFQKKGARLAIFDFKTQALKFLEGTRFDQPARYSVFPTKQDHFGWVNHRLPLKKVAVTNHHGIYQKRKEFFTYGNWFSSWQIARVFSSESGKSLFLTLKKWDKNQVMLAHYALDSENIYVVSGEEWLPEVTVFYDVGRKALLWIHRYSGKVELRHHRTLKPEKTIRQGVQPLAKSTYQPGRSKFAWRLEAPHQVQDQLFFQFNRFLDGDGQRLKQPVRQALSWDGTTWSEKRLYPLAFHQGQFLAFDRESQELGLTADLNGAITIQVEL